MTKRAEPTPGRPVRASRWRALASRLSARRHRGSRNEIESQVAAELSIIAERRTAA